MKFLADENVEQAVIDLLRTKGFDVKAAAEALIRATGDRILAIANDEDRILITNDKDFGELAFLQRKAKVGILLLRFHLEDSNWKAKRLEQFLQRYQKPLIGMFIVLTDSRFRARKLRG